MNILLYPDPRLRRPNEPVGEFGGPLERAVREMFELMYATKGVGLAAPQVGMNSKMLVYNPEGDPQEAGEERVLCNPRILRKSGEKDVAEEGCLSFPGIYVQVERSLSVVVEAQDLRGRPFRLELSGWNARIFLHEFDHLDGILFIDRITPGDKVRIKSALEELKDRFSGSRTQAEG